jgi:glycine/D-amino acid oxidase-like deaminating enzyme
MGEYYGIPGDGASGLKVGRHDSGRTADPDTMDRRFGTFPEDEADLREFLGRYMPGANGARLRGSVCMYAMTEDENFIIDRHPRYRSIWTACGFSGHGFKFSSAVGELLAEWALGREPELDMSPFSLSRFAGRA